MIKFLLYECRSICEQRKVLLSVYVKVGETLQEEEVEEEAETIVLQEESEEEEQRSGSLGARYVVGGGR